MSRFWETKPLSEMNKEEWESLCDGCGRCCLHRLEDEDTGEVFFTSIVCKYFDMQTSRCTCYTERTRLVPECLVVSLDNPQSFEHAPATCAYRLLAEGKPLFDWHPLIAGNRQAMLENGVSIVDKAISEEYVHPDEWQDHIIEWEKGGYAK
ncbi:MAG: YcgN family cysteine cluster protein [Gammaproteobacteria bacterium]